MATTTAQLHSTKPELRFCADSNPARGGLDIRDGEDLLQWSQLEIRLNAFRRSTIQQKQFIIIIIIIITRDSFDKYYMPLVYIKDFNASIDNKPFLDQPVKKQKKLIEMTRKNDYTRRN